MSESQVDNSTKSKDTLIGKQLGDYRLTSRLASGGMARVYKAMDYKLQRQAAVKVLEKEKAEDDKTLTKRFLREARAVAALEHDNIITIYQFGEEADVYFLAMKLVKGKDLSNELTRLRKAKKLMEIDRALTIMEQVASALDHAHAAGIVHRDVKPSNILLDKGDKTILTDFGLVLRTSSETTMGTAFGTPRYIAPEQAVSSNKATSQSDIYALGVIFYEILTGQTPFNGDSPMEIALSQISDAPPPPRDLNPNIPVKVERELLKALDKDPDKRHKSASEFVQAIREGYYKPNTVNNTVPVNPAEAQAGAKGKSGAKIPAPIPSEDNGSQTIGVSQLIKPVKSDVKPSSKESNRKLPAPLLVMVAVAVLVTGIFILNGLSGGALGVGLSGGASVRLIYDNQSFFMVNEGNYTLEVQKLQFVRGVDDGPDDFSGDRFPRDILPAAACYQITLQGPQVTPPVQCQPLSEKRHGYELLQNARRLHWLNEAEDGSRIATFEVRYDGRVLTRCDTISDDDNKECHFTWPVGPADDTE